jgi:hypothetical protein
MAPKTPKGCLSALSLFLMPESRFSSCVSRFAAPAFLILLVTAFFWEAALLRRTFFYLDIGLQHYPCRHFLAEQWKQGRWPLWCPEILGGYPLFAEGQAGAAYPLNLAIYPFLKTWAAMNVSIVLHYALAAVGVFLLLRLWVGRWAAVFGAMALALNGWSVSHLIHVPSICAAAWMPLAFYFLERVFREGKTRDIALCALCLAMPFLAMHTQVALYTCLAAFSYVVFRTALQWHQGNRGTAARAALAGGALFLIAFGFAAVQILPTREFLQNSDRGKDLGYEFLTYGSLPPPLLALFLMPRLLGSRGNATDWLAGPDFPFHEMNFYMGLLPLFLAVFALAKRRDAPTLFFALLLALSGLFMLGKYTPFYRIHEFLPVFNRLRMPCRYAYLALFSLSVLAGLGLDELMRPGAGELHGKARMGRKGILAGIAVAIFLPLATGLWTYGSFTAPSAEFLERLRTELLGDGLRGILFLVLSAAVLILFSNSGNPKSCFPALLVLISALDLWTANRRLNPTIEPAYYEEPPKTAQWLLKSVGVWEYGSMGVKETQDQSSPPPTPPHSYTPLLPHSHMLPFRSYDFDRREDPTGVPGWEFQWPYFELRERLNGCLSMSYGVTSFGGLVALRVERWWAFETGISANRLGVMAVRYVVGKPPRDTEFFRELSAGTPVPIYENLKAAPRAFFAQQAIRFSDMAALVQTLESPEFDPRTTVLLEDPEAPEAPMAPQKGLVRFRADEPDQVVLEVESDTPAYLVLADTWFPGWSATIDERPTAIYRANFFARAVYVPHGQHVVKFLYRPMSFRYGAITSIICILCCVWGCLVARKTTLFPNPRGPS